MKDPMVARAPKREQQKAGYDPARLRRGAARAVKKLGPHQYAVAGNEEPVYFVNLDLDVPCTCKDAEVKGRGCLHELAARLHDGDHELIMALGQMLLAKEAQSSRPRRGTPPENAS